MCAQFPAHCQDPRLLQYELSKVVTSLLICCQTQIYKTLVLIYELLTLFISDKNAGEEVEKKQELRENFMDAHMKEEFMIQVDSKP
eukprot:SAG11_NODE_1869_length_4151_cov_5.154245_2_plen_86_part_00